MLETEHQEHEGGKDGNTLYVGYNYDETAASGEFTKGLRPASVRYPNGRLVHDTYGSAAIAADNLNAIKDDSSDSPGRELTRLRVPVEIPSDLGLRSLFAKGWFRGPNASLPYFVKGCFRSEGDRKEREIAKALLALRFGDLKTENCS